METSKTYKQGDTFINAQGKPEGTIQFDVNTGKRLNAGQTTTAKIPPTINSENTASNPSITLPPRIPQTGAAGLGGAVESAVTTVKTQKQLDREDAKKTVESGQNEILGLINDLGNQGATKEKLYKEQGVDVSKKKVDEYTSQIEQEALSARRKIEALTKNNPEGMSARALQVTADDIQRESTSKQADLAILQMASLRQYDTAVSIADRQLQAKLEPLKAQLEARKFLFDNNKDLFNKADAAVIKEEDRAYDKLEKELTTIKDIKIEAAKQGASPTIIAALSSAKSLDEALKIPGVKQYMTTDAERLDKALKSAQIASANRANRPTPGDSAPTIKTINGVDMQWNGKQWVTPTGGAIPPATKAIVELEDKIKDIDGLIDHKGLHAAVGATFLNRGGTAYPGQRQDFIAGVQQLTSKDTLGTLIDLKKAGGTLGALSDQERIMLKSAATKIGSWEITDSKGKVTGYKASEQSFKKELQTIKTLTERAYNEATGSVDNYLDTVDSTLQTVNGPYSAYIK